MVGGSKQGRSVTTNITLFWPYDNDRDDSDDGSDDDEEEDTSSYHVIPVCIHHAPASKQPNSMP